MSTNTIQLKEKLNFHQYQMIVNFLEEIGIEVLPPQEDPYDGLSLEELQKITLLKCVIIAKIKFMRHKNDKKDKNRSYFGASE